jgi:DNA-binding NtrC family response regulator
MSASDTPLKRLLVVDDDVAVTNFLLVFFMQTERFDAVVLNDSREVLLLLEGESFDALLLDMDMPSVSGLDILARLRERGDETPVLVLTGVSDVEVAVKAMKAGAFDYLTKPVDEDHLLRVLDSAIEHGALKHDLQRLPTAPAREDLPLPKGFSRFPNRDPAMVRLFLQAEKMARSDLSIFIHGERGTGKEQLAKAIHACSALAEGPFVALDVAEQAPEQFPQAFFGQARDWAGLHEERSGFLDEAQGGTLYLDNIEQLSMPMQVRLKRLLQTGTFYRENSTRILEARVRFIVASTQDLANSEFNGNFSRDLLYHLMVNSLAVPPLRERPADIEALAEKFVLDECEARRCAAKRISGELLALLRRHPFPDNAQELKTILAASVAFTDGDLIGPSSLPPYILRRLDPAQADHWKDFRPRRLDEVQREHALRTLEFFGKDRRRTAFELGIDERALDALLPPEAPPGTGGSGT